MLFPPGGYLYGYPLPAGIASKFHSLIPNFSCFFASNGYRRHFAHPNTQTFQKSWVFPAHLLLQYPPGKIKMASRTKKAETSVVSAFCLICLINKSVVYACHSTCTIFFVFKIEGNFPCTIFVCKTHLGASLRFCRFSVRSDCFFHCTIQRNSLW